MPILEEHPTVKAFLAKADPQRPADAAGTTSRAAPPTPLEAASLIRLALESGADDAGVISLARAELDDQRADILAVFPWAKSLVALVARMTREPIRSPARSVANLEFHHAGDSVNEAARRIVAELESRGIRAANPAMGFPMEMDRWPEKIWVVSHKPVAVAAGLGRMGIHRNVIHPRFGSFVLLGTVVTEAGVTGESRPLAYNPCLECKLCVAACPTGAIAADGHFNFSACYTHNYREFMGGFTDWVENVAESRNALDYRRRTSDAETVSMWQSLSFGANYKAAYCVSVCPAGEDVIPPFLTDRAQFLTEVVKPLQQKAETVYVAAGSDAEEHVARRFPQKRTKRVGNGLRPHSIRGFLGGLRLAFQRGKAKGLDAVYHFTFTGEEKVKATVAIHDGRLEVLEDGAAPPARELHRADSPALAISGPRPKVLRITADSRTWLEFLAKERGLLGALVRGKIRVKGDPRLLRAFARCFPL
jgi:Fe-S-cluster-containing hydrogenase component 2